MKANYYFKNLHFINRRLSTTRDHISQQTQENSSFMQSAKKQHHKKKSLLEKLPIKKKPHLMKSEASINLDTCRSNFKGSTNLYQQKQNIEQKRSNSIHKLSTKKPMNFIPQIKEKPQIIVIKSKRIRHDQIQDILEKSSLTKNKQKRQKTHKYSCTIIDLRSKQPLRVKIDLLNENVSSRFR